MPKLRVDVWSDLACPWCYVGKRRLEVALAQFAHADEVEVVWRAFELDPSAPRAAAGAIPYAERLARKYRTTEAEAEDLVQRMTEVAARDGLDLRFDRARPANTFDAHRLLHLARESGRQDALQERLLHAGLHEGLEIGDPDVLLALATEVGLDREEVRDVLSTLRFGIEVRAEEDLALELGIAGVPFFIFAGRLGVSGAQASDLLVEALDRGWEAMLAEEAGIGDDRIEYEDAEADEEVDTIVLEESGPERCN